MASLDEEIDRLYGLPLAEFTKARDALARDLRAESERTAADDVRALAKPSVSAWTVNQLARSERLQVRALLTAGERLRAAQEKLLREGDRGELQAALERQREVVGALVDSARALLAEAGQPATEATLERVRTTLTAAAADEEGAKLLERGRLTRDLEPAGFGGVAAVPGGGRAATGRKAAKPSVRKPADARRERAGRVEEAKAEVGAVRAQLDAQRAAAREAAKSAREAEREAAAARRRAERAEADLERLAARLEAARAALAAVRSRS